MAAVVAILATFLLSFVKKETMMTPKRLWDTFILSGQNLIMLGVTCAGAGMIISIVTYTRPCFGCGYSNYFMVWWISASCSFSGYIYFYANGNGYALYSCIYNCSYYRWTCYAGNGGRMYFQAHLFVFYFAILAEITPPVCIASYCGANIAQSKPMETGFESLKLALVGFIIPYIFIYNPALLLQGSFMEIISLCFLMIYIIIFIAAGLQGFYIKKLNIYFRTVALAVSALLVVLACSKNLMDKSFIQIIILVFGLMYLALQIYKKAKTKIVNINV